MFRQLIDKDPHVTTEDADRDRALGRSRGHSDSVTRGGLGVPSA